MPPGWQNKSKERDIKEGQEFFRYVRWDKRAKKRQADEDEANPAKKNEL